MNYKHFDWKRLLLGTLLAIVAVNAIGGGYYGLAGAKDVPLEWLDGSPFSSYFLPGLFLFVVLGGTCSLAAVAVFRNTKNARQAAFLSAILMVLWIIIQVLIIGYVSWMQPAIFFIGITVLILTNFLPRYRTT